MQCKNYQGISLLRIPGNVYAKILDNRIRDIMKEKTLEEQGDFRKRKSCVDQLFTVRMLSEKTIAKNKRIIIVCVDLEKAYEGADVECARKVWNWRNVGEGS